MTFHEVRAALAIAKTLDPSEAAMILAFADEPGSMPERSDELDPWHLAASPAHVRAARIVFRFEGWQLAARAKH